MKYCFGTVCWGGYLERYVDIFAKNYITLYKKLISLGVNDEDIMNPIIVYVSKEDTPGEATKLATKEIKNLTGKKLMLVGDRHTYTQGTIMYSTRNRLRLEFRKMLPANKKVFFYFPIDDSVRPEVAVELYNLSQKTTPTACMFRFMVTEGAIKYSGGTRPICSWRDIHPGDWGGYCAYNILNEAECPLYPRIDIPNVAFYAALYEAGYKEYQSKNICIDHLRHEDSHHFKTKDTAMTHNVSNYLLEKVEDLRKKGYK